eukprot:4323134-Amphidinium_carterae.1
MSRVTIKERSCRCEKARTKDRAYYLTDFIAKATVLAPSPHLDIPRECYWSMDIPVMFITAKWASEQLLEPDP